MDEQERQQLIAALTAEQREIYEALNPRLQHSFLKTLKELAGMPPKPEASSVRD